MSGRLVVRERAGLSIDALYDTLARSGARRVDGLDSVGATVVQVAEADLPAVEAALRRSGVFRSVERDYLAAIAEDPDDPYYIAQWGLPRTGVPAAWELADGSGVLVAVIDTGIETDHPDLQGQVVTGYDFLNGDADPSDDHGHGTRMAGIVAARGRNGLGVIGVAPQATVLSVKALDAQGLGPYSAVAAGMVYAVDQGAKILSLSLSGATKSSLLQDAVNYAKAHEVVVVAASGNYGSDVPNYPAATTGAVAVAAINEADQRPIFSNYGAWISVAAPGDDVVTTTLNGSYSSSTGTSPAAAFASGIFALLSSANPTMTRAEMIARVQNGAIDLGSQGWDAFTGWGRIDAYAALVPGQIGGPLPDDIGPTVSFLSPSKGTLAWGMVPIDVAANDNVGVGRVELYVDNQLYASTLTPPYSFVVDATAFTPGQHKLRAYAYDTSNNLTRGKTLKVWFTPGAGLLVHQAVAKPSTVTIKAKFALPEGTAFDSTRDSLGVVLTSADGTVLSATAAAGSLSVRSSGKVQGDLTPAVPSSGRVRVTSKTTGSQPVYELKVKASNLTGMTARNGLMNLTIQAGTAQLSQSLSFRNKGSDTLLYP